MEEINVTVLKGKKNNAFLIGINSLINYIVLVLLIGRITSFNTIAESDYQLNSENVSIAKLLDDYYAFPIVRGAQAIDGNNQRQYNELLDMFYADTKEIYKPIIIDCNNYMSYAGEKSLAEQYNQLTITVNEYYLEINPVHDIDGNVIVPSDFEDKCINVLIPDTMEISDVIDSQFTYYKSQGYEFNCIYYKSGEIIRSISPFVGENGDGLIIDPVIIIYDSEIIWGQMLNYVSGEHIFFRLESENPYEEILPVLKEYHIDGILLTAEPISNIYDNSISYLNKELRKAAFEIGFMIFIFCFTIFNMCRNYIRLNEKKFAVKIMYGYRLCNLNFPMMLLIILQYIILFLLSVITHYNLIVLSGMFLVHLAAECACFYYFMRREVYLVLKRS